jgi:hypothetical protein
MQEITEQPAQPGTQVDTPSKPEADNANPSKNEEATSQNLNINRKQGKDDREEWQTGIEEGEHEKTKADESNKAAGTGNNETVGIP